LHNNKLHNSCTFIGQYLWLKKLIRGLDNRYAHEGRKELIQELLRKTGKDEKILETSAQTLECRYNGS